MADFFDTLMSDYGDRQALERKQNKAKFYDFMKENGFDFNDITDEVPGFDRLPKSLIPVMQNNTDEFHKFNHLLSKLEKEGICTVADAAVYLHTDYLEVPQVLKCLDELNFYAMKTEFLKRYRLQLEKKSETTLLDFLDADF